MKYSSKQYAKALYETLAGREKDELPVLIKNFTDLVITNGDVGKFEDVMEEFSEIWNEKEGIIEVEISSAKKISAEALDLLRDYLKKKLLVREVKMNEVDDKSLLGGAVLKYKDKVIDASLRNRLKNLETGLKS